MPDTNKIRTTHPTDLELSAALFSKEGGRVKFILWEGETVTCTVVSISTGQGQKIIRGSCLDDDGNLDGFYEADLVQNTITFR